MLSRHRRKHLVQSEVNITPLIDVMTSLLAIFMITAPLLTTGIPLDLPKGDGRTMSEDEKTLDLGVNAQGEIFIGRQKITQEEVLPKVKAIVSENPKVQMVISADKKASYGTVIELMALLRAAGYTQVGLKTDVQVMEAPKSKSAQTSFSKNAKSASRTKGKK